MTDKTDREIMQQALNDLEALVAYIKGGEPDLFMQVPSIDALRERLAQPELQPLTYAEMRALADEHLKYQPELYEVSGVFDLIRAVEAKLKEKND